MTQIRSIGRGEAVVAADAAAAAADAAAAVAADVAAGAAAAAADLASVAIVVAAAAVNATPSAADDVAGSERRDVVAMETHQAMRRAQMELSFCRFHDARCRTPSLLFDGFFSACLPAEHEMTAGRNQPPTARRELIIYREGINNMPIMCILVNCIVNMHCRPLVITRL